MKCNKLKPPTMLLFLLRPYSLKAAWISGSHRANKRAVRVLQKVTTFSNLENDKQYYDDEPMAASIVPRKFVPFPFPYHHVIEARVESLTNLGVGICRVPVAADSSNESLSNDTIAHQDKKANNGWVVMVPNVIPGELVRMRVFRNHGKYSEADLLQVIEKHPKRVTPKCKLSSECGGCQYQHMDISLQREWKAMQVQDLFERVGKFPKDSIPGVRQTLGTNDIYHYRSKITPHYDAPERSRSKEMEALGFQKKNSRHILDVAHCDIATVAINQKLTHVREELFTAAKEKTLKKPKKGATLLLRDAYVWDDKDENNHNFLQVVETNPNVYVKTTVKSLVFRFLAGNFFQNNPFILNLMVDRVIGASITPNTKGDTMTHLIDCYCGSGLFCLSAASHFDVCVGIEVNDRAIAEAQINAELNRINNCKFIAASAEAIFESEEPIVHSPLNSASKNAHQMKTIYVKDFPRESTVVVVDPPRKGCSEEFLEQLFVFQPQRVVYMSCDPATQARDAQMIAANGYRVVSIEPIDLFPQTRHIECLVVFERKVDP